MSRSVRWFDIIQRLRCAKKPLTAQALAESLNISKRTVYRDIATLQTLHIPIDGAAGIGYILRPGYVLPPLMFNSEELEAIAIGLALLGRTGDKALQSAAIGVEQKISAVLPRHRQVVFQDNACFASTWHQVPLPRVDPNALRQTIRDGAKIRLRYADAQGQHTQRTVIPLALVYYIEVVVLAAWCDLRSDFRHFRVDRIIDYEPTRETFVNQSRMLRAQWRAQHRLS